MEKVQLRIHTRIYPIACFLGTVISLYLILLPNNCLCSLNIERKGSEQFYIYTLAVEKQFYIFGTCRFPKLYFLFPCRMIIQGHLFCLRSVLVSPALQVVWSDHREKEVLSAYCVLGITRDLKDR